MGNPDRSASTCVVGVNALREQILAFVQERTEAVIRRFMPDLRWPHYFAGYTVAANDVWALVRLVASLHSLGVRQVAGYPTTEIIATALRQVDGKTPEPFASFKIAETILTFGRFQGNPLLHDFSEAQRANLVAAVNSTHIYDPQTKRLHSLLNNYWAVLARCESAQRNSDCWLTRRSSIRPRPWCARCWHAIPWVSTTMAGPSTDATTAIRPMFACSLNRSGPCWNRKCWTAACGAYASAGSDRHGKRGVLRLGPIHRALSVNLTMEMAATALKLNLAENPTRLLGLIGHALDQFRTWYADDLIIAHRGRMTFKYRDVQRLLQMTFDCLEKICFTAELLASIQPPPPAAAPPELFPPRDQWIPFDNRNAGVWMYRQGTLEFQFAVVGVQAESPDSDYVPWFRCPGVLENPVDSPMLCGVPRIFHDGADFVCSGLPTLLDKQPGQLRLVYEGFRATKTGDTDPSRPP